MTKAKKVIVGEGGVTSAGWHQCESFLRCPKEYQFSKVRGISVPADATPDYFAVGILFHAGRAVWFSKHFATDNKTWVAIKKKVEEECEKAPLPIRRQAEEQALRYIQEYVNWYCVRPKPEPLAVEYLLGPAALDPSDPLYPHRTARLDDVSRYPEGGGKLYIGEAKTEGTSVDACAETYLLHGQPLLQTLLWRMAPQGEATHGPVEGVMLDVLVKGRKGARSKFARMPIPITQLSLDWYIKSMSWWLRAAQKVDWNSEVPRNITACTRKAGSATVPCQYRDLCRYGQSVAGRYVGADGNSLVRWTPDDEKKVPPWE